MRLNFASNFMVNLMAAVIHFGGAGRYLNPYAPRGTVRNKKPSGRPSAKRTRTTMASPVTRLNPKRMYRYVG